MKIFKFALATLVGAVLATSSAQAAEKVSFILNWVAGGDHAPVYWAESKGWYKDVGIDLTIEQGKGSTLSSQRVGIGKNQLGIADLGTALVNKGKGADLVAVFNIMPIRPTAFIGRKARASPGSRISRAKKSATHPGMQPARCGLPSPRRSAWAQTR